MLSHSMRRDVMKLKLFKNITKIITLFSYSAILSTGLAMEQSENVIEEQRIRSYFQEDASVIREALESIAQAELHFFWTTGLELDALKVDYGANLKVNIGGAKYAEKFPLYVELLLMNSPAHLIVKFVCDEMTRNSNNEWIITLQKKYTNRFQILDIQDVVKNVIQPMPDKKDLLLTLFQNATKGNPAIASDVYRLIGMVYGSNPTPEKVQDTQYTYCDVDTFCFGMTQPNQMIGGRGHTDLVKVLFVHDLTIDAPVYIGRQHGKHTGNDLIKLWIRDLNQYKNFCY